jgi:ferredoxin
MSDRDVYVALAQRLSFPLTERFERLLRKTVTPQEGLLLAESPAPSEQLAAKTGMTPAEVDAKLREFVERGLMVPTKKGHFFSRSMVQFHDAALASPDKWVSREMLDLWEEFAMAEWYPAWAKEMAEAPRPRDRVIPHFKAIENMAGVQPYENVNEIVASATRWSVVPCTCRRQSQKCDYPVNVCLQLNRAAAYTINRGAGPELSKEEALAIIEKSAEAGLIHQLGNRSSDFGVICNCCTDCCIIFRPLLEHRPDELERGFAKSRFEAAIDQDLCNGCQLCVDRCQLNAIEMRKVAGSKRMKAAVDEAKCWGCGACVTGCTEGAATLRMVRPLEYIPMEAAAH